VSFEGKVFGSAQSVQHVATAVRMNILGKSPTGHIFSSALLAIWIAGKSEIAPGGESGA
jgi:hypothetical protein